MEKKYYYFLITMLLILIITVINIFGSPNIIVSNSTTPSVKTEEKDIVTNKNSFEKLSFGKGVTIDEFKEYGDDYLAIGTKNDYPYMQIVKNADNGLVVDNVATDYNINGGKVIDILEDKLFLNATILNNKNDIINQDFFVSKDSIIPYYKKQLNINYSKGVEITPKYIVIHETANTRAGADADAHYRYWSTNSSAYASTHFVVDATQIYQMLELNQMAWHVGDNKGYSDIVNSNSIGIEITVNSDGNYDLALQHTIELTIQIMRELDMDISQLKMHNDASGKLDPITFLNDPSIWKDFINQVKIGLER